MVGDDQRPPNDVCAAVTLMNQPRRAALTSRCITCPQTACRGPAGEADCAEAEGCQFGWKGFGGPAQSQGPVAQFRHSYGSKFSWCSRLFAPITPCKSLAALGRRRSGRRGRRFKSCHSDHYFSSLIVLLFSSRNEMKPKAQFQGLISKLNFKAQFSGELSGLPGHREILQRRASRRNASIF